MILEDIELLEEEIIETDTDKGYSLVVYNDDVNTFDHVIQTLIEVCHHTRQQAEQCTYIIHYKEKCTVKEGSERKLTEMKKNIHEKGINAKVIRY